jgi:TolB protein
MRQARHLLLAALAIAGAAGAAQAQDTTYRQGVTIGLRYTPGTKPGLIVLPVAGAAGDSVRAILQRDFDFSDRINVIGQEGGFPETPTAGRNGNYPVYAKLGAAALVQATVTATGLHVALHDVAKGAVARRRDFPLPSSIDSRDWRLAVHNVSDEIERWITGALGIASTRVAYSAAGRIWIIDSDGANPTPISEGGGALAPAWHPRGTHVAYTAMRRTGGSYIVVRELGGGSHSIGAAGNGLSFTPVFSPDGVVIVYSHGEEWGTDLFATPAAGGGPSRRITVGRGSDNVSPTFSPDGRRLAFTSGRSGHPEVYISDADGTNVDLLTSGGFGDQLYRSNPDWSPDGRLVAFQSLIDGRFQVMTISLRDRTVKQLTNDGSNEDPSWAPDGRHIVFSSTRGGSKQLWVLDSESGRTRLLTTARGARTAEWSPALRFQ